MYETVKELRISNFRQDAWPAHAMASFHSCQKRRITFADRAETVSRSSFSAKALQCFMVNCRNAVTRLRFQQDSCSDFLDPEFGLQSSARARFSDATRRHFEAEVFESTEVRRGSRKWKVGREISEEYPSSCGFDSQRLILQSNLPA